MNLVIEHKELGMSQSWTAKTSRGFNRQQLKEQNDFREQISRRLTMRRIDRQIANDPNYQAALLEWMTAQ